MRFSKKSEYGLRAMIELTQEYGRGNGAAKNVSRSAKYPAGFPGNDPFIFEKCRTYWKSSWHEWAEFF